MQHGTGSMHSMSSHAQRGQHGCHVPALQFHTPRNLILAMMGEVGELSELFMWKGDAPPIAQGQAANAAPEALATSGTDARGQAPAPSTSDGATSALPQQPAPPPVAAAKASYALPPSEHQAVAEELSDVLLYLVRLADVCNVDLARAVQDKMAKNARKYPADKVR